jgi:hypothetical protein
MKLVRRDTFHISAKIFGVHTRRSYRLGGQIGHFLTAGRIGGLSTVSRHCQSCGDLPIANKASSVCSSQERNEPD